MSVYKIAGTIYEVKDVYTRIRLLDPEEDKYQTRSKLAEIQKKHPEHRDPLYNCRLYSAVDVRGDAAAFRKYENRNVILTCLVQLITVKGEKKWKLLVKQIELINKE